MDYSNKIITVEQALGMVKSGDYIISGLGPMEAKEFMCNLQTIADRVKDVTISNCLPLYASEYLDAKYADSFKLDAWFFTPAIRKAFVNGNISYIPNALHFCIGKRLYYRKPNIFVGGASMPDKNGYVSLSCSNCYEMSSIAAADLVILEINPNMPYVYGDHQINLNEVDYVIPVDYKPAIMADAPFSEKDIAIGKTIADMVPDGACIQLGIGGIPNAVGEYLKEKNDLGVHTELITNSMVQLAKMGVITGKAKQINKGQMVATMAMGSEEFYEYLDHNPSVAIMDGSWVNNPFTIAQNDNQISINTTLEVDLVGQCASESIGTKQFSGSGGQRDTAMGAYYSKNGKSIIALYSTAMVKGPDGEKHEVSKIVPTLQRGACVSLSRNDIDWVVTEYGAVQLRGTSVYDRVEKLISIAHPKFRDELWDQAVELGIIGKRR